MTAKRLVLLVLPLDNRLHNRVDRASLVTTVGWNRRSFSHGCGFEPGSTHIDVGCCPALMCDLVDDCIQGHRLAG